MKLNSFPSSGAQELEYHRTRIVDFDPDIVPDEDAERARRNAAQGVGIAMKEDAQEETKRPALALLTSNKRKRIVESDSESGSEDHVPLAMRQFSAFEQLQTTVKTEETEETDELIENIVNVEKLDAECERGRADQGSGTCADASPLLPAWNIREASLRWAEDEEVVDLGGREQEFENNMADMDMYGEESDGIGEIEDDDDDEELGDSAFCAICDDGGDLLLCDGPCMRSFHASRESAAQSDSGCRSLKYKAEEVKDMGSWQCPNCVFKQHQCFICEKLGKSDGDDKEVFVCDVALCGRFFHPICIAKWKRREKYNAIVDEAAFIRAVKEGTEEFCCPAHKCRKCGQGEVEGGADNSMKLAKCRRCPKAYHKQCLPKKISFDEITVDGERQPVRAWEIGPEDDPMKRLVMYCLAHEIVEHLSTPARNHLKWPNDPSAMPNAGQRDSLHGAERERERDRFSSSPVRKQQKLSKSTSSSQMPAYADDEDDGGEIPVRKPFKAFKGSKSSLKRKIVHDVPRLGVRNSLPKPDPDLGLFTAARKDTSTSNIVKRESSGVSGLSVPAYQHSKHLTAPKRSDFQRMNANERPVVKHISSSTDGRLYRISDIIRRASETVTLETVKETLVQPSCYTENRKKNFMPKGEILSVCNAIKKAAEKVKNGGSVEDAKRLCPKDLFMLLLRTLDMLKVHLAPVLHGMRYTSFGRHFTSPDKLQEIVNRIHPYIDNGDMIVDFCCGANDFSIILNAKLLSLGKTCQFKNFDIHPPKNDFCFTKGDWLQNPGEGFLEGNKLIMGLNPPFGVRSQLANRFIVHAMKFKPKLLVLIVPPETMSGGMQLKNSNYDLVWEDKQLLYGHAFYLPGSVDDTHNENMSQWNVVTPPLYLWSSSEMIQRHQDIAVRAGHIQVLQSEPQQQPLRQTSTPTPPPQGLSRHLSLSDKRSNSGSNHTDCNSSSSHLQHSATSSQNSLERVCFAAEMTGQISGDRPLDPSTRHQMYLERAAAERATALGHGAQGHPQPPLPPGPPPGNHPAVQHLNPSQQALNPSPCVFARPSGSPDLFPGHLSDGSPASSSGSQGQRMQNFRQRPNMLNPLVFPGCQPWPGQQHPSRHGFSQHLSPLGHGPQQHLSPLGLGPQQHLSPLGHGPPQGWQGPVPHPHFPRHGIGAAGLFEAGGRGWPQVPTQMGPLPGAPPILHHYGGRGQARGFERRPGGNQPNNQENGTGGWLE